MGRHRTLLPLGWCEAHFGMPIRFTKCLVTFHANRMNTHVHCKMQEDAKVIVDELAFEFTQALLARAE